MSFPSLPLLTFSRLVPPPPTPLYFPHRCISYHMHASLWAVGVGHSQSSFSCLYFLPLLQLSLSACSLASSLALARTLSCLPFIVDESSSSIVVDGWSESNKDGWCSMVKESWSYGQIDQSGRRLSSRTHSRPLSVSDQKATRSHYQWSI